MTGRYDSSGNFDIIIHAARAEPRRCNLTRPVLQIDMEAQDVLVGRGVEVVRRGVEQVGGARTVKSYSSLNEVATATVLKELNLKMLSLTDSRPMLKTGRRGQGGPDDKHCHQAGKGSALDHIKGTPRYGAPHLLVAEGKVRSTGR